MLWLWQTGRITSCNSFKFRVRWWFEHTIFSIQARDVVHLHPISTLHYSSRKRFVPTSKFDISCNSSSCSIQQNTEFILERKSTLNWFSQDKIRLIKQKGGENEAYNMITAIRTRRWSGRQSSIDTTYSMGGGPYRQQLCAQQRKQSTFNARSSYLPKQLLAPERFSNEGQ